MNLHLAVHMILTKMLIGWLMWPTAIRAYNIMDTYGKNQLIQNQNRHNSPAWYKNVNLISGWVPPYLVAGGDSGLMMRNYERRLGDNEMMMNYNDGEATINKQNSNMQSLDDYYNDDTADVGLYGLSRPHERSEYAVVKYPSYHGYYPFVDNQRVTGYDAGTTDDQVFQYKNGLTFENRNSVVSPPATVSSTLSSYYTPPVHASAVINNYVPPAITLNRGYEMPRFPTDKLHRFRKVFFSNVVSPSNVFKSPEERQVNDFWESLIKEDLIRNVDDNRITTADRRLQTIDQDQPSLQQFSLLQHLPPIFQRLQKQQQKYQTHKQRHQQPYHQQLQQLQQPQAQRLVQYQNLDEERKSSPSIHHNEGSSYNQQWVSGSPLIKKSSLAAGADVHGATQQHHTTSVDNDDVRQLEKLKSSKAAAGNMTYEPYRTISNTTTTTTTITVTDTTPPPPMADGGQREYVLPRPAGEKSGLESLFEVIAEGGLRGKYNRNAAGGSAFSKLREEIKVNKKRTFVTDETSLAAQLGALRKN